MERPHALRQQQQTQRLQMKVDNGPESSGVRTQFLKRMVEFAEQISKPIHLLYYPPYHSEYNPIERCWGILERHWNGAKLTDALTMMLWAKSMTSERSSSHSQVESQDLSNRYFFDKKSYALD